MKKSVVLPILIVLSIFNMIGIGYFFFSHQKVADAEAVLDAQEKYPYLSKRILSEFPQDIKINFLELRKKLRDKVDPYGETFGFYFEYLPTGTSIARNGSDEFHAASLFKVPVVMAYYHANERLGRNEDELLVTLKPEHIDKEYGTLWKKGPGAQVQAAELVDLTLQESDNTAAKALLELADMEDFEAVYQALDIDLKTDEKGALVSAISYSSVLKALYFSSVLSKESSQEILDHLTKTEFPDRIAAGVPSNVPVAHKIGDFMSEKNQPGFRDCGIVYETRRPYLICMYSVSDADTARARMQEVSKMIYDYVSTFGR